MLQRPADRRKDIEELAEGGEAIRIVPIDPGVVALIPQRNAVALGQFHKGRGTQATFEVTVQVNLGQARGKRTGGHPPDVSAPSGRAPRNRRTSPSGRGAQPKPSYCSRSYRGVEQSGSSSGS